VLTKNHISYLVVVFIAIVIIGVVFKTGTCYFTREVSPRPPIQVKLHDIYNAISRYADDHNEILPETLADLVPSYLENPNTLLMDGVPVVPDSNPPTCFVYIPYSVKAPADMIILYPNCVGWQVHTWLAVVRLDGEIIFVQEKHFKQVVSSGRAGNREQ
jgi:hypothetical protein